MPANERRFWWCTKGHIMGEIRKISLGGTSGAKVRALLLFEKSLASEADIPKELPPLRMTAVGDGRDIACTICGHLRDWNIGEDAMEQLLSTRVKMHLKVDV